MKIKRDDIAEEIRYCWECPKCGQRNEETDDPDSMTDYFCDECNTDFEIEE